MARHNIVMVRLNDEEFAKLTRLGDRNGMKLATFMRWLLARFRG